MTFPCKALSGPLRGLTPIQLLLAPPPISTPVALPSAAVPFAFVPIRVAGHHVAGRACTRDPNPVARVARDQVARAGSRRRGEPPIVLFVAPLLISTPTLLLGRAALPAASVPIRLPATTLPVPVESPM